MIALTQFLGVVLAGVALIGLAVAVGGGAFQMIIPHGDASAAIRRRALMAIAAGAVVAAAARLLARVPRPLAFAAEGTRRSVAELLSTQYAQATLIHAVALCALAALAWRRRRAAAAEPSLAAFALAVLATGAWLTHAASRVDDAALLMALTASHQLGAALWMGGIAHLAIARRAAGVLWPQLLARFSPLALTAVLLIAASGITLAWRYVGDWGALIGTGYGAMVMAKVALFATALALGYLNYRAVGSWRAGSPEAVSSSAPVYVQAELAFVITAILTAASLTSQAPSADLHAEHATPAEVVAFFAPKQPRLVPPPRDALLASANRTTDAFGVPGAIERAQNNFNHNLAGVLVFAVGIAALMGRLGAKAAARHWPLLFLPLAAFVFVFAEPTVWPWGPEPFWATLAVPAVLQHRLAALLVLGLAIGEWRVSAGQLGATRWRFVFPVLCAVGGAMLLTHSHTVFATKSEFLIELSHAVLGFLAVVIGVARWLELRLPHGGKRVAGFAWPVCLIAVAWVLFFYREA